jgi:hypothetical protein
MDGGQCPTVRSLIAASLKRPAEVMVDVFGIPLKLFTYNEPNRFNLQSNC